MIILSRFCLQKCMSHTTVFYKAKPKAHTYMYSLRSSSFIKSQHSTSQETLLWSWNLHSKAYLVTLAKIQDTQRHEVAPSHSSCILSFDLIGQHQSKKFYVKDIVLLLRFVDIIFRRKRSDNTSVHGLLYMPHDSSHSVPQLLQSMIKKQRPCKFLNFWKLIMYSIKQ